MSATFRHVAMFPGLQLFIFHQRNRNSTSTNVPPMPGQSTHSVVNSWANPSNSRQATCLGQGQGNNFSLVAYKQLGYSSFTSLNMHILLEYSWLTMFQVHSKVYQLYIYIILEIIFHYSLLQDTDYSSLCYTVINLCCLLQVYFVF